MTIGYVARRLVEAYGRDAARDKAHLRATTRGAQCDTIAQLWGRSDFARAEVERRFRQATHWRSVARACTRVPVPARRGATP